MELIIFSDKFIVIEKRKSIIIAASLNELYFPILFTTYPKQNVAKSPLNKKEKKKYSLFVESIYTIHENQERTENKRKMLPVDFNIYRYLHCCWCCCSNFFLIV